MKIKEPLYFVMGIICAAFSAISLAIGKDVFTVLFGCAAATINIIFSIFGD